MKLFCEACQRIGAPGSWSVIDGLLRVRCSACGAEAALQPRAAAAATVPLETLGPGKAALASFSSGPAAAPVPDIDRVLAEFVTATPGPATAATDRWELEPNSLAAQEADAALDASRPEESIDDEPWLAIGWAQLQQSWNDPAAHQRLLAEAVVRGDFAALGVRYRDHLARAPHDAVAVAARDELLKKATAQLFTQLPYEAGGIGPAQAKSVRNALLVVFLLGVIGFGAWVLVQMGGGF